MRAVDQDVLKHPAHAGCVGANHGARAFGHASAELLDIFENARARPVQVGAVLKNHEDIGVTKHGLRAHGLYMRSGEQCGDDRICNLIFDDARRTSRPGRMHDDLHVRDIRQSIQRNPPQRPDARQQQEQNSGEYQKPVSGAPFNDARDHG